MAAVGTPGRSGDKSLSVRVRLLEATIAAIEESGEAGVRIDRICDDAHVAKASLYHSFGDRDGLVAAAQAERYRRAVRGQIDEYVLSIRQCHTRDEFAQLLRDWVTGLTDERGVARRRIRVDVLGSSVSRPSLRDQLAEVDQQVAREVAALLLIAHDRGWINMPFDLETAAMWWYGMLNGRYMLEHTADPARLAEWDRIATTAMLAVVFTDNPPTS